jgi:hypothetical protein
MALSPNAARLLANTTIGRPIWPGITPRWLLRLLPWVNVSSGTYRCVDVVASNQVSAEHDVGSDLPVSFANYRAESHEFQLSSVQTVLKIHTKVLDVFNGPHDQLAEQLRLTVEAIREEQEFRVLNSPSFGLIRRAHQSMRLSTKSGAPTPDDLDELLARVWKKPAFFLAHPKAIAAFGRECTARGVCIGTVEMFGSPFWTWRGVPIVPSDKVRVDEAGKSTILLMRVGEEEQGVFGLHQTGIPGEHQPSLSVRLNGIDTAGVANYIVTLYFSVAVTSFDALGVLELVDVGSRG